MDDPKLGFEKGVAAHWATSVVFRSWGSSVRKTSRNRKKQTCGKKNNKAEKLWKTLRQNVDDPKIKSE